MPEEPELAQPRPLSLGYISGHFLVTSSELRELTNRLAARAHAEGFTLGTVYVERPDRSPAAFGALLTELEGSGASAVVVPTLHHLTVLGGSTQIRQHLEHVIGARVLIARSPRRAGRDDG
jgi:hypothetical protein